MPALPFNPVDLAPVFPDVVWAIGIALILAIVTSRPPKAPSVEDALSAMRNDVIEATIVEDDDAS